VIAHFYHVYAAGDWREPVEEHCTALLEHGLFAALDEFYIGMVGSVEQRQEVLRLVQGMGLDPVVVTGSWDGWEQETLRHVQPWARQADGVCFYAHTKSAWNPSQINCDWRRSMCYFNVVRWEETSAGVGVDFDVAGCHWLDTMFGGNYWWASTDWLRRLPALRWDSRWDAEGWVALGESPRVKDVNPGHPANREFVLSW
jgi:hypothetical protein